jgi:enterochelin esterase-like enzyme
VGGSIALYFWNQAHPGNAIIGSQVAQIFGKADVRAGRLALFACLFAFAFLLSTLAWGPIRRLLGWLLLPMGQNALTVYTLHLFVIVLVTKAGSGILGGGPYSIANNTLLQAAAISIIWAAVIAKAPAGALFGAAYRESTAWLAARLRLNWVYGGAGAGLPRFAVITPLQQRLGKSRPLRLGLAGMLLVGVGLVSTGPALAVALRNNLAAGTAGSGASSTLPTASETAVAAPTGVADISREAVAGMSTPASAAPAASPAAGRTESALPDYIEKRTFLSVTLNRVMPYYVYLPPGYDSAPNTRYPVLYMLHGISGSNDEWLNYGLLSRANEMMRVGQISQFLIVLPQGDQGYWLDQAGGGPRWGTYVVRDVVNEIDANFRTLADRQHRAIGGLSMGGYGALQLAINYPDVFGVAGAHSPSLHDHATAPAFFGDQAYFDAHDPVYLYGAHPDIARTLKLWIDDGQQDNWLPVIDSFHQLLQARSIPHEWRVLPGGHVGEYWSTYVPDYLQFYSSALSSASQPTPVPTSTPTQTHSPAFTGPGWLRGMMLPQ